jgi:hypothetical protein
VNRGGKPAKIAPEPLKLTVPDGVRDDLRDYVTGAFGDPNAQLDQ